MKIRAGFVSNSSSASFVFAMQANLGIGELIKIIAKAQKEARLDFDASAVEEAASYLISCAQDGLVLDSWRVGCGEVSNEDDPGLDLLYNLGQIDTSMAKFDTRV